MAEYFAKRSRRYAQLEDELAGQQRQLDTMRRALSNVVDVATHRLQLEKMAAKLANKADLDLLEKHRTDLIEVQREQLSEALLKVNMADQDRQAQLSEALAKLGMAESQVAIVEQARHDVDPHHHQVAVQDKYGSEDTSESIVECRAQKVDMSRQSSAPWQSSGSMVHLSIVEDLAQKVDMALAQKVDKASVDDAQMGVEALSELQAQLADKVDSQELTRRLEKQTRRLQEEIVQARQYSSDVSLKLDRQREQVDMARAQMLELNRQQGEAQVAMSTKADRVVLEGQEEQLESLFGRILALERFQDVAQREFAHLQDQLFSAAARRAPHPPVHRPQSSPVNGAAVTATGAATSGVPGGISPVSSAEAAALKAILHPSQSPREGHSSGKHSPRRLNSAKATAKGSPYLPSGQLKVVAKRPLTANGHKGMAPAMEKWEGVDEPSL